jgi:hypothetical protein
MHNQTSIDSKIAIIDSSLQRIKNSSGLLETYYFLQMQRDKLVADKNKLLEKNNED